MVSITPFGQSGPHSGYRTSDIVAWAMGGQMNRFGDPDRAPVRVSYHSQAYLQASAGAAVAGLRVDSGMCRPMPGVPDGQLGYDRDVEVKR